MRCKIKVKKEIDVFPKYCPKVGAIYEADYSPAIWKKSERKDKRYPGKAECAVIEVLDKRIVLRKGEFEIVGG